MQRTKRYLARLLALAAIAAVAVAVVLIVSSFKDESNDKTGKRGGKAHHAKQHKALHKTKAKTYTIESGDTLTSIAHNTGLTVQEIQALNPEIDPQILIAGEELKLR
jgi:LysM repeat protein